MDSSIMLHPPPTSRQASFTYSLPRRASSKRRIPSFAPSHHSRRTASGVDTALSRGEEDYDDEEENDVHMRMEMEEGLDGIMKGGEERGLEETLERLGFGAYQWRLLALCGFGWMSDNSALQCIGE